MVIADDLPEPMYEQVAAYARQQIRDGAWAVGRKVPFSEVALSKELKVSRATVRRAYQILTAEGVLKAIPARGYFVERIPE